SLRLPAMEKIDLSWYWHTQEQQPQPYTEIDSFRFRESRGWVEIEGPSDVGGWVRWWVGPDDSVPNVTLTIGDDMRAALLLGECAPGSPGAVLLEQRGSEAVALARYRAGYVNGVPLVATHFRVGGDLNTLLASPLERPPARPVAGSWAYETSHVVEAAHRVVQACGDVTVALGELSPAELRTISTGPRADWRSQLETAAAVSKQAKDVLSLLKVGLGLGRDIAELMA
ncbi:MAG TPA: hypothetical protein VES93_13790, partial [Ornithinibacter sp.]|nr:hypothetical protein [Ornithinibacter sp.]